MPSFISKITLGCALLSFIGCSKPPVNPAAYPAMDDREIGHLRWMLQAADQPIEDFTNFEAEDQHGLSAHRYSIAFSAYFLSIEQYHKVPAWSEAIQPRFDRLIQKVLQKPVWEYWAVTSRGVPNLEPDMSMPYPEDHDPVGNKNIMYSGHIGHMVNLYEMLYRDFKWDSDNSMVFQWSDAEKFSYSNVTLTKTMHNQIANNDYHGVCCEPNAVFPECNQHPVLSFVLYDATHGTSLSKVNEQFYDFFTKHMIDPASHATSMLYLVKQGWALNNSNPRYGNSLDGLISSAVKSGTATLESASADGWTGLFMHAWKPEYIESLYPFWKSARLIDKGSTIQIKREVWEPRQAYGFFAALAAELGDTDVRDRLFAYVDKTFKPEWKDGTFRFPYRQVADYTNLTDKLFAIAWALPKDGMLNLHAKPFTEAHFQNPVVQKVDYPNVILRRAIYDSARKSLVISTVAGAQKSGTTTFVVNKLNPGLSYRLFIDGVRNRTFTGRQSYEITVDLESEHNIVLTSAE